MSQISTKWIEDAAITKEKINVDVKGNGLIGGAGSPLEVLSDPTGGANLARVISVTVNGVAVKVDAATIDENGSGQLEIPDLGVTNAKLAGSIEDAKLTESYSKADGTRPYTNPVGGVTPVVDSDLATKGFVEALVQGLLVKDSVRALEEDNVASLTGVPGEMDGVVDLADGDRVLLIGQSTASQNGIWEVHAGAWTRPGDFDTGDNAAAAFTFVEEGTEYSESGWTCTNDSAAATIDTHNLTWVQFSGAGQITAGAGLTKSGNTLDVGQGFGVTVSADSIAVDPAKLILGGNAEIDGDKLDIDFTPANYTPNVAPAEVDNVDHLTSHLKGLDDALAGISTETIKQEMHKITAGEVTAGYFTLSENPENAQSVRVTPVSGPGQINKQCVGATGATPDFDVLSTNQLHINNAGAATGLSVHIGVNDILIIRYQY